MEEMILEGESMQPNNRQQVYRAIKSSRIGMCDMTGTAAETATHPMNGDDEKNNLEKILQKREKWIKIDDYDVSPGCSPGENFVADVFRIVVYGRRLCLGVWTDMRRNLIVKRIPAPSSPRHKFYNCLRMFQNEITAYEHVLPMCQRYLDDRSMKATYDLCFPKYFGQCHNFLVLQDLQTEGYQVVNRVKGFSMRECSLILQELARFHALSFALKKHETTSFLKATEKLKETVFREEYKYDITGVFWENSIKFAVRSLNESNDPRLKAASSKLELSSGRILTTLINIIRPDYDRFDVICHGDLWSNNILLRYCEAGYPVGVKFVDLQAMRYSSCVLDVMHVLFTSSRPVIYERHLDLLSDYHDSLVTHLESLDTDPGFTFQDFMAEFKRKISFGAFVACLMFTCLTRTSTTPEEPSEENLTKANLTKDSEFERMYKSLSPGYHERLRALFLALTASGLI